MSQGPDLVMKWLSRLHLAQYVEAFLDNGYDDLEVCRQIGRADLDAIGVRVEYHRHRLLAAVRQLRDSDRRKAPGYYFALEPQRETAAPLRTGGGTHLPSCPGNHDPRLTDCNDFVIYPKLKLKVLIREKLAKDGIDLGDAPYSRKDGSVGTLEDLAKEYSRYYGTSLSDVCERMEELRRRRLVQDASVMGTLDSAAASLQLRSQIQESLGLCSATSTPETGRKFPVCKSGPSDDGSGGRKWDGKRKSKFFWNTFRKTPKGVATRHLAKGDLVGFVASEITMSDEERIQLMMMVKENMISIEEALARLKEFEMQKKCRSEPSECTDVFPSPDESLSDSLCELSDTEQEDWPTFRRLHKLVNSTRKAKNKLIRIDQTRTSAEECCQQNVCPVDSLASALQEQLGYDEDKVTASRSSGGLDTAEAPGGSRCGGSPDGDAANEEQESDALSVHHRRQAEEITMARSVTDGGLRHRLLSHHGRACSFGGFDLTDRSVRAAQHTGGDEDGARSPQISRISLGKKVKSVRETMRKHITKRYQTSQADRSSPERFSSCPQSPHLGSSLEKAPLKPGGSVESLRSSLSGQSSMSGQTVGTTDSSNSNRESVKSEDGEEDELPYCGPFCGRALVHTDFTPSPYDADSLKLKSGDTIDVISKPPMGTWMGMLRGKVGTFKFIYVDMLNLEQAKPRKTERRRGKARQPKPQSVDELLERIDLKEHLPAFLFNGYDDLDTFRLLEEEDLDELRITDTRHRAVLLAAVQLLHDYDGGSSESEPSSFPEENAPVTETLVLTGDSPRASIPWTTTVTTP
ncbi:SAM and SH3 domain-containing protein 1-like isoform X2 [Phycodurus eques]|uniref:SAM and SH3 domain-containing protein 1-like isoform X2 n=1 Tax=Phycodurus eques TaxID=693459 RepID=UPI002ACEF2F2|nr:SAM and SH3 domain-containing protein 1-like isoform X2 [Phycodurus eques]